MMYATESACSAGKPSAPSWWDAMASPSRSRQSGSRPYIGSASSSSLSVTRSAAPQSPSMYASRSSGNAASSGTYVPTRFPDAENRDDHRGRPRQADAHRRLVLHAVRAQPVRHAIRGGVELRVTHRVCAVDERRRSAVVLAHALEEQRVAQQRRTAVAPRGQRSPLCFRQQLERTERSFFVRAHLQQQRLQLREDAIGTGFVEMRAVEMHLQSEGGSGDADQRDRVMRPLVDAQPLDGDRGRAVGSRIVLKEDQRLEEPRSSADPGCFLHLRERSVRVLVPVQLPVAQLPQPGTEHGVVIDVDACRHAVDQHADQIVRAGEIRGASGNRDAEEHITATGVVAQEDGPRALHQRIDGDALCAREQQQRRGVAFR